MKTINEAKNTIVDVPEAARIYDCSGTYILDLIEAKKLAAIKKGGRYIMLRTDVERLAKERKRRLPAPNLPPLDHKNGDKTDNSIIFRSLRSMSGIDCPDCLGRLNVGMVSLDDQRPALFCPKCGLRLAITIEEVSRAHQRVDNPAIRIRRGGLPAFPGSDPL